MCVMGRALPYSVSQHWEGYPCSQFCPNQLRQFCAGSWLNVPGILKPMLPKTGKVLGRCERLLFDPPGPQ